MAKTKYGEMSDKVKLMSDEGLKSTWAALGLAGYYPDEMYSHDITMEQWAEVLYSELCIRGITRL